MEAQYKCSQGHWRSVKGRGGQRGHGPFKPVLGLSKNHLPTPIPEHKIKNCYKKIYICIKKNCSAQIRFSVVKSMIDYKKDILFFSPSDGVFYWSFTLVYWLLHSLQLYVTLGVSFHLI